jgi:hypothetical protein
MSSQRHKRGTRKHPQPSGRTVAAVEVRLPPSTGFRFLTGKAKYLHRLQRLSIKIFGKKAPDNHGRPFFLQSSVEWSPSRPPEDARRHVEAELAKLAGQLRSRSFPERGLFIDDCNRAGAPLDEFLEEQCTSCICWYCELCDG